MRAAGYSADYVVGDGPYNPNGTLALVDDLDTGAVAYGYDAYLRQDRVTYPGGTSVCTLYDLNGLLAALSDEWGRASTYDANGNLRTANERSAGPAHDLHVRPAGPDADAHG